MRNIFIYISLIVLTATFTLGESFASMITSSLLEEVDFSKERETEVEEEYNEAVLENEQTQYNSDDEKISHVNFSKQLGTAFFHQSNVVKEDLFLLHCSIIR